MYTMKHLFRDVSHSKDIRRELWSTLSYHCAEKELCKERKRSVILAVRTITLVCFAVNHSGTTVFEIYKKITLYKHWHTELVEKQWLQTKTKTKKEAKNKPIWSSHISYCRLLILFSFIVVPNVFPSYWNGCYVCTLQREMIKEIFFFLFEK